MPVKLIKGNTYSLVREGIAEEIKQNLTLDKLNVVIVPEDITLTAKREFAKLIGKNSIFGLKVLGFAELAKQFVSDENSISKEQGLIIFKSVVKKNKDKLKSFAGVVDNDGAIREMFSLANKLCESAITTNQLAEAGTKLGGILGAKAEDIALLCQMYYQEISDKFCDSHLYMKKLSNYFESNSALCDHTFYFSDFGLMTAEQLMILQSLTASGNNVVIGVVSNQNAENNRIYPRFLIEFCKKIAFENIIDIEIKEIQNSAIDDKSLIVSKLYGYTGKNDISPNGDVSVHSGESVQLEIKGICRMIRQLVVEEGIRYCDISIFCSDIDKYKGDIAREFGVFEIPYFLQDKTNLASFAISKLLIDGLAVIKSEYQKSKVIAFSKNILLGLQYDDVCKFELYVNKYNVDKKNLFSVFEGVNGEPLAVRAEIVRQKLVELLKILDCDRQNIEAVVNSVKCFYEKIFEKVDYNNYLLRLQQKESESAKMNAELAKSKIFEILDMVGATTTSCAMNGFDNIVSVIKNTKVCVSKQFVDNVFITGNQKEINSTRFLFVIGANDGVFVPESSNISLFTYNELEQLTKYGVNFCPNLMDINFCEKFEAVQLLAKGERVYVCFNQELGEPALIVKNICDLLGIKVQSLVGDANKIGMNFSNYATKIGTKSNAKRELSLYYSERMRGIVTGEEKVFDYLYTKLDGEFRYQNLIKPKNFEYVKPTSICWSKSKDKTFASISALERYFDCPFKFYCERMLKLKKTENGSLDVMVIGSFIHRILEKLFRKYKQFDMSYVELAEIIDMLCNETIAEKNFEVLSYVMSPIVLKNSLFKKVQFIAKKLVEIAKRRDFDTLCTELTFGFNYSKLPPYEIKSEGKSYFIRGKIDRIDKFGDYIAIIDYKTSSKVSYGLKEIYYGERVQLLIYLNAYLSNFNQTPFALLYMPLPYSYSSDETAKTFAYTGLVRNLESIFPHFDSAYQNQQISSMPISFNTKGELKEKDLLSQNDLNVLLEYADKVVVQAIKEIESGYIEAKPTDCTGCEYGEICLNKFNPAKTRKKLSKKAFSISEEAESNGED